LLKLVMTRWFTVVMGVGVNALVVVSDGVGVTGVAGLFPLQPSTTLRLRTLP
jgi:hypothetical protein